MGVLDGIWGDADTALVAVAAGALWLAAAAWVYTTRRPLEPLTGARTLELGPEPPAIANLLVNGFEPTGEAVPATVIDLAARRFVDVEQRGPGVFFLRLRRERPERLAAYEQRVHDLLVRHASDGVVPADALTTGSEERSQGWRSDFEAEVVVDAKARGLVRRASQGWAFFVLAVAGVVPALPALLTSAWGVAALVLVAEIAILGWIDVRFPLRETPEGLEAASRWLGVRAELAENPVFDTHSPLQVPLWSRLLAYGAALGVASAASAPLPLGAESDTHAWSSHGGGWRPVRITYPRIWPPGWGATPVGAAVGGLVAAVAGALALERTGGDLLASLGEGWQELWSAALLAALGAAVVLGIALLVVAIPDLWTTGEVTGPILRLRAFDRGDELQHYAAVDDGSSRSLRAFRLTAEQHAALRQGQTVTVIATRNLARVLSIVPVQEVPALDSARDDAAQALP